MTLKVNCEWHDATKVVPKDEEQVLMATVDGSVVQCQYWENDNVFMNDFDDMWDYNEAEFWMPLPSHPTQG